MFFLIFVEVKVNIKKLVSLVVTTTIASEPSENRTT